MEKKKLVKNIFKTIFVFFLFYYSWILQVIPIILFDMNVDKLTDKGNVVLTTFSSVALGIILFFIYRDSIKKEFKKFKENFSSNMEIGVKYWMFGILGMIVSNFLIGILFKNGQANNEEAVQSMIGALPWLMLVNAGLLAPWSEEIVFRKSLRDIFKSKWLYVIISGILFGLAHVLGSAEIWSDWLFILPYGSLGLAFAAAYYDSDTVFTPIAIHILHNTLLVLLSIFK